MINETTNFYLILGFIFHSVGDYVTQTNWMANEKTKRFFPAFLHATVYSLPFAFIVPFEYWVIICSTHFFIDRYRLAVYVIRLKENNWTGDNFGYKDEMPKFLSMWLLFIADNTIHISINAICIILGNRI